MDDTAFTLYRQTETPIATLHPDGTATFDWAAIISTAAEFKPGLMVSNTHYVILAKLLLAARGYVA